MTTETTIECSLFDLLDEVGSLLKTDPPEEKRVLTMHKIENNLETFIENFLLQFFRNGYGIDIEGVNKSSLDQIKRHFTLRFWHASPRFMIQIFEEAVNALEDIEVAVYLNPPKEEDLVNAYRIFIPRMLNTFKKEGEKIQNFGKVSIRIDSTLQIMSINPSDSTRQMALS